MRGLTPNGWKEQLQGWRHLGATHISVNTMRIKLKRVPHIDVLRRFLEVVAQVRTKKPNLELTQAQLSASTITRSPASKVICCDLAGLSTTP